MKPTIKFIEEVFEYNKDGYNAAFYLEFFINHNLNFMK
jgi:uncharacterized protein YccT (UPF0319 family)